MLIYFAMLNFSSYFAEKNKRQLQDYISIISNVGFPIAMCVLFWRYITQQSKSHEKAIQGLKDTLQNNTTVLAELTTLIKTLYKQ